MAPPLITVEVMKVGRHTDANGQTVEFTVDDLRRMVQAFAEGVPFVVPVKLGHTTEEFNEAVAQKLGVPADVLTGDPSAQNRGKASLGEVVELHSNGTLTAVLRLANDQVYRLIKDGYFTRISAEIQKTREQNGKVYGPVLSAVSLLGGERPAIDLKKIVLDDGRHPDVVVLWQFQEPSQHQREWGALVLTPKGIQPAIVFAQDQHGATHEAKRAVARQFSEHRQAGLMSSVLEVVAVEPAETIRSRLGKSNGLKPDDVLTAFSRPLLRFHEGLAYFYNPATGYVHIPGLAEIRVVRIFQDRHAQTYKAWKDLPQKNQNKTYAVPVTDVPTRRTVVVYTRAPTPYTAQEQVRQSLLDAIRETFITGARTMTPIVTSTGAGAVGLRLLVGKPKLVTPIGQISTAKVGGLLGLLSALHLRNINPAQWLGFAERHLPKSPQERQKVSRKIRLLREEGYPPKQAIAIALSLWRKGEL